MAEIHALDAPEDLSPPRVGRAAETATRSIGFLFLHEQPHQIPHLAPILEALTELRAYRKIQAFVMGDENARLLRALVSEKVLRQVELIVLQPPKIARGLEAMIGKAIPLQRIGALYSIRKQLEQLDVIASPEMTCLLLRSHFGVKDVKIVWTQHGCGDRAAGFKQSIRLFDHVFVPGANQRDRMLREQVIQEGKYSVVGYPKFDLVDHSAKRASRIFDNDNPTFVYNPHFDPSLSSWYKHGEQVIEAFANRPDFNLIVAPHIMLFTRKLHMTGNLSAIEWRKNIPHRYRNLPNIHIDTGSINSIDMSYLHAADAYLGDVSSQIYEFLFEPRMCVFLNSHGVDWKNDPNYANWKLGNVVADVEGLNALLDRYAEEKDRFRDAQVRAFRGTFDEPILGGAQRAAIALSKV